MIITYYGNGKGKTTAALGLALRSSGYDKKILFVQFIKSPKSKTGEDVALKKIKNLTHKKFGLGFVGLLQDSHTPQEHRLAAQKGLKYVIKELGNYELVILDEVLGAIKGKLIDEKSILDLMNLISKNQTLVLTGRPKYKRIISKCDLATEMSEIKHPFQKGQLAVKGVDF